MKDADCVAFLQWALPQLRLQWPGYRKVRSQVCKRIGRRAATLGLADLDAYKVRLAQDPNEWSHLDGLCGITISRFYRDRSVFEFLGRTVLPVLAQGAATRPCRRLGCWSAGCASGEEPYTLAILWHIELAARFPDVRFHVLASDANADVLARGATGCYPRSTVKGMPADWRAHAFEPSGTLLCVRESLRNGVGFVQQDIRSTLPDGDFDLVLCRNLVLTYFEPALQLEVMRKIADRLRPGAGLVVGIQESLPRGLASFAPWPGARAIHRKIA